MNLPRSNEGDLNVMTDMLDNTTIGEDSGETCLIIGLDFGTTYSGVAYAFSDKPEAIYTIEDWPGAGGRTYSKCPTLIEYTGNREYKWGFEVDRTSSGCIEGIKLLLDPLQARPTYAPRMDLEAKLRRSQKSAVEVVSDYLRAAYRHAIETIEKKYPRHYLKTILRKSVLSVPAVWSDKAKDATLQAARNAGISRVKLVKEPEAAALFTIHSMGEKGLRVGDALIVCDAGGGTVDLIAYEITSMRPFELIELTVCTGGVAGSLLLNKRFEEWIKDVVSDKAYTKLRESDAYRIALKDFDDRIKPGFRSKDDTTQYVTFPGADLKDRPGRGLRRDSLALTGQVLSTIFDPIFREVERLVKEQVNHVCVRQTETEKPNSPAIKAIFLVGGFGSNKYLYEQIAKAYPKVQVIQPNDTWSAVVRGAVMFQLPNQASVLTSIAPKHYGVIFRMKYDKVRDVGQEPIWSHPRGRYEVEVMAWHIKKGDDLLRSRKIKFRFGRAFPLNALHSQLEYETCLYECDLDDPPFHFTQDAIQTNCTLKTDTSQIPRELFQRKSRIRRNGDLFEWLDADFDLVVTIESGPMLFSLQCGGKEYGQVSARY